MSHIHPDFPEPYGLPVDGLRGKNEYFSHPVYLFLRKFSLQDSRGGSSCPDVASGADLLCCSSCFRRSPST
ncbi:hypothetical protein CRG85_24820 (plasmid) [Escherichia coli]|nr:hypothetical protein CRG85_24820 [Escherichia coli]